jgi:hypothetical protein
MKFPFHNRSFHNYEVNDNRAILGYYAATSGNSLPTFRDRGQKVPLLAAY